MHRTPFPDRLDAALAEADALRCALLQAQSRLHALRQSDNHERVRADGLQRRLDEAEAALRQALAAAREEPTLRARILAQDEELALLRRHLDAFEHSALWRATWPVRRVLRRRPGLARAGRRLARLGWWTLTLQAPRRLRERARWREAAVTGNVVETAPAAPVPDVPVAFDPAPAEPTPSDPRIALPTSDAPVVSVIVPCFGQVDVTLRCLRAIAASDTRTPFEVIVAEDASGDPAVERLALVQGLLLLRNETNLGFLRNCNEAALSARGRLLLFLNNDTEPLPGFLDALAAALDAVPGAGLVGAKLLFPDGRLQEAGGIVWQDATGWNYGRGDDPALPQYNTLRDTDYVSGAAMLLERALFEALGGFDPRYAPAYYEDTDLAFRVRARGLRVLFQPASVVVHHEGLSHGTDLAAGIKAGQELNRHRFAARWPSVLAREHMPSGEQPMRAAEHARARPTMLVIDHYVPEPDRDAGSRSTMAILRALRDRGWVVRFWPANRARNDYTTALECMGIAVLDGRLPLRFEDWIAREGRQLDHVLVMRPTVAPEFLSGLLQHTAARLSFYGHDVHHLRMRRQAVLAGDDALLREADAMERRERALWALFDRVLYPSEAEAALVRRAVPQAEAHPIVPFAFDRFVARHAPPPGRRILFVAGFAHPPNIDAALWLAGEIMPIVWSRVPDAVLVLAGSHPTEAVRALGETPDGVDGKVVVTGSLDEAALQARYAAARVAIVPLRVGAGVKGKVVEALQQGLPLATTPIGAEGIEGLDRVCDVLGTAEALADSVCALLRDDRLWCRRSAAQRGFAAERFSRRALADSLFAALGASNGPS